MSDQKTLASSDWGDCPRGTLSQGVRAIQRRRRNQEVFRLSAAAVGVFALVVVVGLAVPTFREPAGYNFGDITCAETKPLLPVYAAGNLDAQTAAKIDAHLAQCPHCRPMFEEMKAKMNNAANNAAAWNARAHSDSRQAACHCAACRGHDAPAANLVAVRD